jgi:SPP1 gp7 family putative phage head morphogenesis protein
MSKTIRIKRDPARAKPLIREYEKRMGNLFKDYQDRAQRILAVADAWGNRDVLFNDLRAAAQQINAPGRKVVQEMTYKAYRHGQAYADIQLKRAGITPDKPLSIHKKGTKHLAGVGINFSLPPDQQIFDILLGKSLSDLKGITDAMSKKITDELAQGILKGEGMEDLANRITSSVEGIGYNRAILLARTETMDAVSQATMSRYHKAGVTRVEWLAGADNRCCDYCIEQNGKTFDLSNVPEIPAHPNCRCALAPLPED